MLVYRGYLRIPKEISFEIQKVEGHFTKISLTSSYDLNPEVKCSIDILSKNRGKRIIDSSDVQSDRKSYRLKLAECIVQFSSQNVNSSFLLMQLQNVELLNFRRFRID